MKAVFKFKDGVTVTSEWGPTESFGHGGDFLESIKTGVKNNANVSIEGEDGMKLERKWSDLYSIELIL